MDGDDQTQGSMPQDDSDMGGGAPAADPTQAPSGGGSDEPASSDGGSDMPGGDTPSMPSPPPADTGTDESSDSGAPA